MEKNTDVKIVDVELYFLPLMRVPLKFGNEISTGYDTARVKMTVESADGRRAEGWGESPLSPAWAWPGTQPFSERLELMRQFCRKLVGKWKANNCSGHPIELGNYFNETQLDGELPHLAALTCCAPFDLALHDAYGNLHGLPVYQTYNAKFMNRDLSFYFGDEAFKGLYPEDFFVKNVPEQLPVWHLVGGKDVLDTWGMTGNEPDDGYPVTLIGWIESDGLKCLKIKLTGIDAENDYRRCVEVGRIAIEKGVPHLSADFNCTVSEPEYVNDILDRLLAHNPEVYNKILYVEQPFPYDLESNRIDVHSVSARKPLFMDESAHNWRLVKLGRELGWTGVALKTCKTQTGALLSACWAKKNGMTLMVQDLTNPRLAIIPHVLLAAHVGTIMGVECNACQFYPEASKEEAVIHSGLLRLEIRGHTLAIDFNAVSTFFRAMFRRNPLEIRGHTLAIDFNAVSTFFRAMFISISLRNPGSHSCY
jgi:L-alanine-DL-glutamate epimerase-like enolase superfamily enzyme